ncbi:hypothetical protein [Flavobacterium sp. CSZ]|uniref:hypothetical protein n=1 Tax=Flavobacterium sp. CSZ TaxID=2783791 RepID=UPI00188B44DD|nr:hypothetical protein [Flavobacterium sp. CSZ]MBF4485223.1 hypothetical protein [Flavobacterium sp. CSZ]
MKSSYFTRKCFFLGAIPAPEPESENWQSNPFQTKFIELRNKIKLSEVIFSFLKEKAKRFPLLLGLGYSFYKKQQKTKNISAVKHLYIFWV